MKNKRQSFRKRIQEASKTLQILYSPLLENNCKTCKHWKWTHNMWGKCSNPKIARGHQQYNTDNTVVFISSKGESHINTLQEFGCTLFEKKEG